MKKNYEIANIKRKICFSEEMNKIDKHLARQITKKNQEFKKDIIIDFRDNLKDNFQLSDKIRRS